MGTLEFHTNAKVQFFCSWDVWQHKHTPIELYGLDGSMIIPDPNFFSGDILVSKKDQNWEVLNNDKMLLGIPNQEDNDGTFIANYRGIGLSDMIDAIINQRKARCSLDLAIHVLEVMEGIIKSSENRSIYTVSTKPDQPLFLDESDIEKLKK
jgi:predicted dehydrogenase